MSFDYKDLVTIFLFFVAYFGGVFMERWLSKRGPAMTTDYIAVQREYEGERCGLFRCHQYGELTQRSGHYCNHFEAHVLHGRRCLACLATPPVRVLTEEMVGILKAACAGLDLAYEAAAKGFADEALLHIGCNLAKLRTTFNLEARHD